MIGLGKWQGTVNIQILKFSGDVFITISDVDGAYNVDIQLQAARKGKAQLRQN